MSQPPAPYDRSWSFTNFSQSNPTTPHQGQKIDQELNNARTAINATISRLGEIQADDGKIRTTALNLPVIAEEVEPLLTDGPVQAVNAAGAQQVGLVNAAGVAGVASLNAVLTSQNATDALAARDAAQSAAYNADISRIAAANSAGLANTYANTALQAKNSAIVHAQVAVDAAASIPLIVGPVGPQGQQGIQGIQGIQGVIGPVGPVGPAGAAGAAGQQWVYRGAYDNGVTYAANDYVTLGGSSYVMINTIGAGGYGPITHPYAWQLIASKGDQGIQGIQGIQGPVGSDANVTSSSIATALGYTPASKSGDTFTGKVNTTVTATTAPINIGSQATAPTTTVAGDLWIGANINYKSWDGITKAVANTNTVNQFSQGQAISVNSASNAFRINQQGTGPALVVEDSLSPDLTPFVIDANGKVGIGVAPSATAALKVDTNGIMFGDGTTQFTTAATNNSQLNTTVTSQSGSFTVTGAYANVIVRVEGPAIISLDDDNNNTFPTGAQVVFINESGSTITFQAVNNAQVFSADGLSLTKNYGTAVAIKLSAGFWSLSGNLN